jgi:hypothetical protein
MASPIGELATFQFENLAPGKSYSVQLTDGAAFTGAVLGSDESAFLSLKVDQSSLTFNTLPLDQQWVSGQIKVGLIVSQSSFGGVASLADPGVVMLKCLDAVVLTKGGFTLDTGINFPPTCILCGVSPKNPAVPDGYKMCMGEHRWFACQECPGSE